MASKWGKFEESCVKYLNETYSELATFSGQGGSNRKNPDIIATTKSGETIIIEVKSKSAQGFQFTLLPDEDNRCFIYTAELQENTFIHQIKSYMNDNYDTYKDVDTAGISIDLDDTIFYGHAKDYSYQKKVAFFISKYKKGYIISPTKRIEHYFSISGKYRIKPSGSSYPGKKYQTDIEEQLENIGCDYILKMGNSKKKTYVETAHDLHLRYLKGRLATYFCRLSETNKYSITKCSDTKNPNVIFQLKSKSPQQEEDLVAFKNALNH